MIIAAHQQKAAQDLTALLAFRWDTRQQGQDFVEEHLSLKANKPVVKNSLIKSEHCAMYKCMTCDTFKIRIKAIKEVKKPSFLLTQRLLAQSILSTSTMKTESFNLRYFVRECIQQQQ